MDQLLGFVFSELSFTDGLFLPDSGQEKAQGTTKQWRGLYVQLSAFSESAWFDGLTMGGEPDGALI